MTRAGELDVPGVPRRPLRPPAGRPDARRPTDGARRPLALVGAVAMLSGCALVSTPVPSPVHDSSLAPPGAVGYVVCPNAVTPVELATHVAEPAIRLPISGTPDLGDFAITTSPTAAGPTW